MKYDPDLSQGERIYPLDKRSRTDRRTDGRSDELITRAVPLLIAMKCRGNAYFRKIIQNEVNVFGFLDKSE